MKIAIACKNLFDVKNAITSKVIRMEKEFLLRLDMKTKCWKFKAKLTNQSIFEAKFSAGIWFEIYYDILR